MNATRTRVPAQAPRLAIVVALTLLAIFASGVAGYFIRGGSTTTGISSVNKAATAPASASTDRVGDRWWQDAPVAVPATNTGIARDDWWNG